MECKTHFSLQILEFQGTCFELVQIGNMDEIPIMINGLSQNHLFVFSTEMDGHICPSVLSFIKYSMIVSS